MAFDTNSAVSGGLAGASVAGPYGAAAGFVLGGFLGGSFQKGNKKQRRTLERKIRRRQDPAYLAKRVAEYAPLARRTVLESGAANTLQQEVQGNISRRGLTGTGLGTAFQNAAALAPSQFAAQTATTLATNSIDNEVNSIMGMGSYNPQEISTLSRQSAGDIATAIAIYRSLKGKNKADNSGAPDFQSQFPKDGSFSSGYPSSRPWGGPSPYNPGNPFALGFPGARGY